MEDSMIDRPSLAFDDEKVGNKRDRDGEEEIILGRLEKRPSGIILGVKDCGEDGDHGGGGGIIDTFISNVFHKNESVTKQECEVDDGQVMKNDVIDVEVVDKEDGLGVDEKNVENGGHEEGGGIIKDFFSNIFQHDGNVDDDDDNNGDQSKNDLGIEVVDKNDDLDAIDGNVVENGGGEMKDHNAKNVGPDLSSKDLEGNKLKMKPDEYSERIFFLNNN